MSPGVPGCSMGFLGGRWSVPGVSRGMPGGPWEVPRAWGFSSWGLKKGILSGDGIPGGSQGVSRHLRGVSVRFSGSPVASSGIPGESPGGPRAQGGIAFDHCAGILLSGHKTCNN